MIFTANPEGYMSGCLWAPGLTGQRKTVRVFAAGNPHWYTVQCHVMVMAGDDPGRGKLADASAVPHHRRRGSVPRWNHPGHDLLHCGPGSLRGLGPAGDAPGGSRNSATPTYTLPRWIRKSLGSSPAPRSASVSRPMAGTGWIPRSMKAPLPCGEETTCSLTFAGSSVSVLIV